MSRIARPDGITRRTDPSIVETNTVVIPFVRTAFGADGEPVDPETEIRLQVMLDDLAW